MKGDHFNSAQERIWADFPRVRATPITDYFPKDDHKFLNVGPPKRKWDHPCPLFKDLTYPYPLKEL